MKNEIVELLKDGINKENMQLVKDILGKDDSFDVFEILSSYTASYPEDKWLEYLALGIGSESGEILGKVKKRIRGDYDNISKEEFAKNLLGEMSDVLWYIANLCRELSKRFPDEDFSYRRVHEYNTEKLFDRMRRGVIKGSGDNR